MFEGWIPALDDSAWQGPVDYLAARSAGAQAVWHRCGYGDNQHPQASRFQFGGDGWYHPHRQQSGAAGFRRGAYFFPIPAASSVVASYDALMRYTGGDFMELPPMVDLEDPPGARQVSALGSAGLLDWVLAFGERLRAAAGRPPIAYSGGYLSSYGLPASAKLAEVYQPAQWVANYGRTSDYATAHGPGYLPDWWPAVHPGFGELGVFQHSGGNGRWPGYSGGIDLDLISPTAWASYTAGAQPIPEEWRMKALVVPADGKWYRLGEDGNGLTTREYIDGPAMAGLMEKAEVIDGVVELTDQGEIDRLNTIPLAGFSSFAFGVVTLLQGMEGRLAGHIDAANAPAVDVSQLAADLAAHLPPGSDPRPLLVEIGKALQAAGAAGG